MNPRLCALLLASSALLLPAACSDGVPVDPCAGLGCASIPGSLHLDVVDQTTGLPVPDPAFSTGGGILPSQCIAASDAGGGACATWLIDFPSGGAFAILVTAQGYAPLNFTVEIDGPKPGECCGVGSEVDKTVQLTTL